MSKDERPGGESLSPEAIAIGQQACAEIREIMQSAFDRVRSLPDGNPAEQENDALSLISHVTSFAGVQYLAFLMAAKGINPDVAWPTVVVTMQQGMLNQMRESLSEFRKGRLN